MTRRHRIAHAITLPARPPPQQPGSTTRFVSGTIARKANAPVAQRIERLPPEQEARGSSPLGRTNIEKARAVARASFAIDDLAPGPALLLDQTRYSSTTESASSDEGNRASPSCSRASEACGTGPTWSVRRNLPVVQSPSSRHVAARRALGAPMRTVASRAPRQGASGCAR